MSKVTTAARGGTPVAHRHVDPYSDGVKQMQLRMQAAGIDPGPIDGLKGPLTRAAMRKYEELAGRSAASGLGVDPNWAEFTRDKRSGYPDGQTSRLEIGDRPAAPRGSVAGAPAAPRGALTGAPQRTANGGVATVIRDGKPIGEHIAPAFDAMKAAAAREGVDLKITSGYRSRAQQEALWRAKPVPGLVARPGTSMHEQGSAIDFANTRGAWDWLKRNAAKFGLINYPREAWHYSTNGR